MIRYYSGQTPEKVSTRLSILRLDDLTHNIFNATRSR